MFYTHVVYGINKWIVTAIAHGEPIETEPNYVDIRISEMKLQQSVLLFIKSTKSSGKL